jgi:Lipase
MYQGAQGAGMVANYLKPGRKLKRITGLDPAKPLFVRAGIDGRIDENDADFVE